jgi:hypothetical protein
MRVDAVSEGLGARVIAVASGRCAIWAPAPAGPDGSSASACARAGCDDPASTGGDVRAGATVGSGRDDAGGAAWPVATRRGWESAISGAARGAAPPVGTCGIGRPPPSSGSSSAKAASVVAPAWRFPPAAPPPDGTGTAAVPGIGVGGTRDPRQRRTVHRTATGARRSPPRLKSRSNSWATPGARTSGLPTSVSAVPAGSIRAG